MHKQVIQLPACLEQDLKWEKPLQEAKQASETDRKILWNLQLGLERRSFPLEDELTFQGMGIALKRFTETVYSRFGTSTLGVILFKGPLDLVEHLRWSDRQKENFAAWQEAPTHSDLHRQRLFCLESYIAYIQMLSAKLPDECVVYCDFDASSLPRTQALHLLSKERFLHLELLENEEQIRPRLGVCLPEDRACTPEVLEEFETLLQTLEEKGLAFCIVNEGLLTEQWDGLEEIIVLASALSARGKRKLMGFLAAGGSVTEF